MHQAYRFLSVIMLACLTLSARTNQSESEPTMQVHYVEIVTTDVAQTCSALEKVHGVSFGEPNPDLGNARVAESPNGSHIAVRAPLADHETPIVRTYFAVDNIAEAVKAAEEAGAMVAYPPTRQGDTGTWAIYILDGIQYGLWQRQ